MSLRWLFILQLTVSWLLIILCAVFYGDWTQGRISLGYAIACAAIFSCFIILKFSIARLRKVAVFEIFGAVSVMGGAWLTTQSMVGTPSFLFYVLRFLCVFTAILCLARTFVLTAYET